ncbi:MAG TPA: hypothetical protein ENO05_12360 [Bacteroides sp.]|nr:hypothetical protein [Bacteroides sp.]
MKTKKYSLVKKAILASAMMCMIAGTAFAQTVEERKGGTSTYSVAAGAPTDEYRWTIEADVAPVSVSVAGTGSGGPGDPYIIDWTTDLTSIDVEWAADGSPDIASTAGNVTVQKRLNAAAVCASPVQNMDISFWSLPSAEIDAAVTTLDVCSGDAIDGSITINLTGAPDAGQSGNDGFEVIYDVAVDDPLLTVSGTDGAVGDDQVVTSDGATVTIDLPDALVNTDNVMHTYTITLNTVEDDFDDGPYPVAGQVYTINVYPTPTTGVIQSTGSLTRR